MATRLINGKQMTGGPVSPNNAEFWKAQGIDPKTVIRNPEEGGRGAGGSPYFGEPGTWPPKKEETPTIADDGERRD